VGAKARYHGLVPVGQALPVFASVAEAAQFLATNPYLQPAGSIPPEKLGYVDTDNDGLLDTDEMQGWSVKVWNGIGYNDSYKVTSNPKIADTDGDGLMDNEECASGTNPRKSDTDGDGIGDYEELNVYRTCPTSVDSDCDCLGSATLTSSVSGVVYEYANCDSDYFDGAELFRRTVPTSPTSADTDGDGRSDRKELQEDKRSPRVADVPQLQVMVTGAPQLTINNKKTSTLATMDQALDSTETTHSVSTTNSFEIGGKLGASHNWGKPETDGGNKPRAQSKNTTGVHKIVKESPKPINETTGELSGSYSHSKETTDAIAHKVETIHQTVQTNSDEIEGYTLKTSVTLTNVSETPLTATVTDLVINCVYQVPDGTSAPQTGYLEMKPDPAMTPWAIGPKSYTTIIVSGKEDSASGAEEMTNVIASGGPIKFTVAQCSIKGSNDASVANMMETVMQNTSCIVVDYGPYDNPDSPTAIANPKPEAYYVATNIPRLMPDSTVKNGLTLAEALAQVGISAADHDYEVDDNGRLIQFQGWPADLDTDTDTDPHPNGGWFVKSTSDSLTPDPENPGFATYERFDTIWLAGAKPEIGSAPDFVELYWMDDQDGDGLLDTVEVSYGTDPAKTDTDGDGLSDFDEIAGFPADAPVYYTCPLQADTDGDGLRDDAELNHWQSDPLHASSLAFDAGLCTTTGEMNDSLQTMLPTDMTYVYFGDFNGDGLGDFIRQRRGYWDQTVYTVQVFYGDGKRGFINASLNIYGCPDCYPNNHFLYDPGCVLIVGDFNGDKRDDFLRQERGGLDNDEADNVELYLSRGKQDGYFEKVDFNVSNVAPLTDHTNWNDVMRHDKGAYMYAADFDGDGVSDILRQEHGDWDNDNNTAMLFYGSAKAGEPVKFTGHIITADGGPDDVQHVLRYNPGNLIKPGDFNGDGLSDLLVLNRGDWADNTTNNASIYLATTTPGHFSYKEVTSTGHLTDAQSDLRYNKGADVLPGDFNGDGKCDFLRQERGSWASGDTKDNFLLYIGDGNGAFASQTVDTTGYFSNPMDQLGANKCLLDVYDFNNDGHSDFMRRDLSSKNKIDAVSIYLAAYVDTPTD
jgi:hypothetical protein